VGGVGSVEHDSPLGPDLFGPPVVDIGGGVEADPGVAVVGVIPAEEPPAERQGVLVAAEPLGELGPILRPGLLAGGGPASESSTLDRSWVGRNDQGVLNAWNV
jgi:hypothetical protein